ncbi:MAG: DUF1810 family protein [Planctomycetes bacterium]|nr:DUF1810 family protein [Planctomycetota bacterium]
MSDANDPYNLSRFVQAQEDDYEQALSEIRSGRKRSHWMWYVFPQYDGLGFSPTTKRYAIKSVAEAKAYLNHPVLGPRLMECAEAVVRVEGHSASEIFGSPDDMKLQSCATLTVRNEQACVVGFICSPCSTSRGFFMVPTLQELGLDQLPPEDRLAVAEAIWDSVVQQVETTPLTPAQQTELERRLADSIAHPEAVVAWEEIKARALARAKR